MKTTSAPTTATPTIRSAAAGQGLPTPALDRGARWCVAHLMSRRWLVAVSIAAHLSIVIGLFVSGVWRLDRLEHGPLHARLDGWRPPPPPASSSGPVAAKLPDFVPKAPKTIAKGIHQPQLHVEDKPIQPEIGSGEGSGAGSGSAGDVGTCRENC